MSEIRGYYSNTSHTLTKLGHYCGVSYSWVVSEFQVFKIWVVSDFCIMIPISQSPSLSLIILEVHRISNLIKNSTVSKIWLRKDFPHPNGKPCISSY